MKTAIAAFGFALLVCACAVMAVDLLAMSRTLDAQRVVINGLERNTDTLRRELEDARGRLREVHCLLGKGGCPNEDENTPAPVAGRVAGIGGE